MSEQPTIVLGILNGTASLVALYITARAYRAYRRAQVRFMLMLAAAFAVLTIALVAEGFAFEILGWPLARAHVLEAALNLVAFLILAASLHISGSRRSERVDLGPPSEGAGGEGGDAGD